MLQLLGSRLTCLLAAVAAVLVYQHALADLQIILPKQKLERPAAPVPPEPLPQQFGALAVTDGRTILVSVGRGLSAYAYAKDGHGRWIFEDALTAPEGSTSTGAAVRGKTALVQGTAGGDVAFVFRRKRGEWSPTQSLANASGPIVRRTPLGLGSNFAAIGSWLTDNAHGAVFIYDKVGADSYVLGTKLTSAAAAPQALTGITVVVDRNRVLASSGGDNSISSFLRTGGVWVEQASLRLPDGLSPSPDFGFSGSRAVVPAFGNVPLGPARVFIRHHDGIWTVEQTLVSPVNPGTFLGPRAAMDGRRLLITDTFRKTVYLFERRNTGWLATAELGLPSTCEATPTLSMSGRVAVVACVNTDAGEVWTGRVLVYELPAHGRRE
jgi:hypothetical protein